MLTENVREAMHVLAAMVRRIVRIFSVVIVILAISAAFVRQPVLTSLPYRSTFHADPHALETHVRFLADNRRAGAPEYIANEFRLAGGVVTEQAFLVRKQTFHNVIATFGPNDPNAPVIVVGAHYDAFGDFGPNPGADDNASGAAGFLELARLLDGRALSRRGSTLVAYANEEPPWFGSPRMGSAVHARVSEGSGRRGMICLEMIGYFDTSSMRRLLVFRSSIRTRGNFIAVAGRWNDRALTRHVKRAILGAHGFPRRQLHRARTRRGSTPRISGTTGRGAPAP